MNSEDVATYLKNNPAFFSEHSEVLAEIDLEGSEPFHRRQVEVLRERHSAERARYELVVESARNNMALEQSLHRFACSLLSAEDRSTAGIEGLLRELFEVEAVRILVRNPDGSGPCSEYDWLEKRVAHESSVCDDRVSTALLEELFGAENGIASCAFVPLIGHQRGGVLVLGSASTEKFQPGMGAIYLDRIGELVSAAGKPGAG